MTTPTRDMDQRDGRAADRDEEEISLLDLLIVLAKRKRLIATVTLVLVLAAVAASLLMTPIYTATTKILPPQQQQSGAAAMLAQTLGGMAGLAGGALGLKTPNDLYIGMLKSRTVAKTLIDKYDLQKRYKTKTLDDTYKALEANTEIKAGKDNIISIAVDDKDPRFAAKLANAYVTALEGLTDKLAVGEASQQRVFFERQLKTAHTQLSEAEDQLRAIQEKTGVIQPTMQASMVMQAVAQAKAEIAAKEVQLAGMRAFATAQNPDYARALQELDALRAKLRQLEQSNPEAKGDVMTPTGEVPRLGLAYGRQLREVKYREALFELMAKQYEMARLDEAKEAPLIQVLDPATPPAHKSKPKRMLMVALAGVVGLFIGIFWAFIREAAERQRQDPEQAERLALLRRYTWGR
ncbi:Wzz/FepE/Etk N-terminal domain-containing protein [Thermithiobacillus tepidarius DSM 3134]|uniref:GumC family protein n=1 Tax=Thermithiobacillus tepidarius TaxID=929 RepID=UPI0003FC4FDC|nr:Wzz/FepE/Etk N-terminal domain-containing protein [Thermithiobacillus tepidarius]